MPRKPPSPADQELIDYAWVRGFTVSATQLERWRARGLLPRNTPHGLGQGRGSSSTPAEGAHELVVWLAEHAGRGRRPHDLALLAFGAGLAVPELTVRDAFRAVVDHARVPGETPPPDVDEDRSDWAWDVAERAAVAEPGALVPRRMRRIDARLAAAGVSFAPPEVSIFDKGSTAEPVTGAEFATFARAAMLGGRTELAGPALAPHIRALLPAGAASPTASWMEYPDGVRDATEIHDGRTGLSLLPVGDVRADLIRVVDDASLDELRAAWHAAGEMRRWALELCAAVEAELDGRGDGAAALEWMLGATLGLARMLLCVALGKRETTPAGRASTAVMLLGIGAGMRRLRHLVPDGQFDLLPAILPAFLHPLAGVDTAVTDRSPKHE